MKVVKARLELVEHINGNRVLRCLVLHPATPKIQYLPSELLPFLAFIKINLREFVRDICYEGF